MELFALLSHIINVISFALFMIIPQNIRPTACLTPIIKVLLLILLHELGVELSTNCLVLAERGGLHPTFLERTVAAQVVPVRTQAFSVSG